MTVQKTNLPTFQRRSIVLGYGFTGPLADVAKVRDLEANGWEGIWMANQDPFSLLAVTAVNTSTIRLGTIVPWTRSVPTMAGSASTVDALSNGRFRLCLISMPRHWNENWHGIDTSRMIRRMREYIEAIRVAWRAQPDNPVNYDGEIYKLKDYVRRSPSAQGTIPIYVGASGPQMVRLAGRIADGILIHPVHSLKTLKEVTLPQLSEGAKSRGRTLADIDISPTFWCSISNDRSEALHWAKAHIGWYLAMPYTHWVWDANGWVKEKERGLDAIARGDSEALIDAISDEIAETICVVGTPDEARRRVAQYVDLTDLPRFMTIGQGGCPPDYSKENLARIIDTFS